MKSKKWSSRLLSMLLVLTMVLGQVPMVKAADEDVDVIYMLTNITVDPIQDIVPAGGSLSVMLSPSEGYTLPDTLEVNGINGAPDYNPATGTLRIDASQITGVIDIVIRGSANAIPSHSITVDPTYKYKDCITVDKTALEGTTVTVTVSREGYTYGGTIIAKDGDENDVPVSGSGSSFSFTMPASDVEITGEDKWTLNSHALTVADGSKDYLKITAPSPLPEKVDYGTKVEFEAKRVGYAVDTISRADATLGTDGRYSFTMPDEDVELSVTWKQTRFNVNVAAGQKQYFGIGQNNWPDEAPPSCDAGSKFTFRLKTNAIPAGYEYKVTGADATPGTYGSYSFTMPDRDVTLALELTLKDTNFAVYDGANEIKPNKDGWYKASSATVEPVSPATKISLDGTDWSGNVSVAEGRTTVYIQDAAGNETEGAVKLDGTAPEIEVTIGGDKITPGSRRRLPTSTAQAKVSAEDLVSGLKTDSVMYQTMSSGDYERYIGNFDAESATISDAEKEAIQKHTSSWKKYSESLGFNVTASKGGYQVILIKAEDNAGNIAVSRVTYWFYDPTWVKFSGVEPTASASPNQIPVTKSNNVFRITDSGKKDEFGFIEIDFPNETSDGKSTSAEPKFKSASLVNKDDKSVDRFNSDGIALWELAQNAEPKANGDKVWNLKLYADNLDEGTYTFTITITHEDMDVTNSCKFEVKREMPEVTTVFSGAGGYEDGTTFKKTDVTTSVDPDKNPLTLYYNEENPLIIHPKFGGKDTHEAISSVSYKVNNGDTKTVDFVGYDYNVGDFTITGLNEGENTIEFTIVAFEGLYPTTKTVTVTVVKDTTAPAAGDILDKDSIKPTKAKWYNKNDVDNKKQTLTLSGISDTNLFDGSVQEANRYGTYDAGTWSCKPEGDQNTAYKVTITDKAGNTTVREAYVNIDTLAPTNAKVYTYTDSPDAEIIGDAFTFGIFHKDYKRIALTIEDAPSATSDISELGEIKYAVIKNTALGGADPVTYADDNNLWNDVTKETVDGTDYYMTALMSEYSNNKCVVIFRAKDNALNVTDIVRSVLIDSVAPVVTLSTGADKPNGNGVFNVIPNVTITIQDNATSEDTTAYSGLEKVEWSLYNTKQAETAEGEDKALAKGTVDLSESYTGLKKKNPDAYTLTMTPGTDKVTIGGQTVSADNFESKYVWFKVTATDRAGNVTEYESEYLNIDTKAPVVTVKFDQTKTGALPTYYAQPRTATITIEDQSIDPITMVKYHEDESGKKLNSAYTITTKEPGAEDTDVTVIKGNDKDPGSTDGTKCVWTYTITEQGLATYTQTIRFDEGKHSFGIDSVTDAAGNVTIGVENPTEEQQKGSLVTYTDCSDRLNFIVDMTDPSLTIHFVRDDNKAFDEYNNSNVTLMINSQDTNGANVSVKVNGTISGMRHFTEDGVYEIVVTATDPAGNATEEKETFTIDQTDPEIVFSGVEDQSAYKDEEVLPVVEVTDKNYEPADVELELVGSNGGSAFYDATDIASGERFVYENIEEDDLYTLTVKVTDKAENTVEKKITFSVNRNGSVFTGSEEMEKAMEAGIPYFRDETLPEIAVYETNVDLITTAKLYLAKDNGNVDLVEGVDYIVERETVNGGWNRYKYIVNKDKIRSDGVYRISLVTEDRAGNAKNAESVVAFVLDNTDPLVQFINIEAGKTYNEEMRHVVFTPQDNLLLSKVQVFVDDEEVATWEGEELEKLLRGEGEFAFDLEESRKARNIKIVLIDAAGNENEEQEINRVTVSTNLFIRIYNNKPLFYGLLAALIGGGGFLWWWFFIFKRRKDDEEENK